MNNIREYLIRAAAGITGRSCAELPETAGAWTSARAGRLADYMDMMGLGGLGDREARGAVPVTVTGVLERDDVVVQKLYYEARPGFYVTANLYLPKKLKAPAPGVLYACGHSDTQKVHYQFHARRFAELGFVCLIVDSVQLGELRGYHHGPYHEGWFHWYSRGYHPAGAELLAGIRGLDLLEEREEVDGTKLGVTGISGGGGMSFWLGAADERIGACAPVCGGGTVEAHIRQRSIDGHCDCMHVVTALGWDMADVGALIAPRPLLVSQADHDGLYSIESVRELVGKLRRVYDLLGAPENLSFLETPGPHSYHEKSRTGIFSWFLKHLAGKDVPPEKVGDIELDDSKKESFDALRVYVSGPPTDARTPVIHDDLVPIAEPPGVTSPSELEAERKRVVDCLRRCTFGRFPGTPCELDLTERLKIGYEWTFFDFTPEEDWRLPLRRFLDPAAARGPVPCVIRVCEKGNPMLWGEDLVGAMDASIAKLSLEPRGVGETSWGDVLRRHVRRACAWTGRTVASMQVYDTLRAIEAARSMPELDDGRIFLAARGEMCAVVLYAALLDGKIAAVLLEDPPASQNEPSRPDGTGPAVEMLQCLRVTDLAQVAGLLWPAELVFVRNRPESYRWTEDLYARLGTPGVVRHVRAAADWKP
ncbi:MAG TPA: hypothetical protein VMZ92_16400 [Planctomycetota bacterium]|nr:hypothetical protein [Planctomycetota bacterium]